MYFVEGAVSGPQKDFLLHIFYCRLSIKEVLREGMSSFIKGQTVARFLLRLSFPRLIPFLHP
ncbi:hypothetical protein N183_32770 [Sinorhizobium sp. Sb3]|nr:hypothetical protein N183_32770 [Sinorhizobium sp. Sb3]